MMDGGTLIAQVLQRRGVRFLFTLCGGHISPILVAAKTAGIRVVDTRHEATAVFAADAVSRLSGIPGVAAVTAGPGVTNTVTAIKNAQLAQSPLVLLGGASATVLRGRGSLQDIDQLALFEPHVKWASSVRRVRDLPDAVEEAFQMAQEGVPGPVFVECPVDLLYGADVVKQWYGAKSKPGRRAGLAARGLQLYLRWHTRRLFRGVTKVQIPEPQAPEPQLPDAGQVRRFVARLMRAERPLILVGSQALVEAGEIEELARAVDQLGVPVYLSGMARGLLGADHPLQRRHKRRQALQEADCVLLAGVPCDFRLDYGRHIPRRAYLAAVNRSEEDLFKNRRPDLAVHADAGRFLRLLAQALPKVADRWSEWQARLDGREHEREKEITALAGQATEEVNPLALCRAIDGVLPDDSVLVADGGDFVATASYIVRPRHPLSWLDPGVFGTLGVGAGFALGAKLCRPESEVWVLFGDGSLGYSLMELDTFVRHGIPIIGVVGNDGSWMQIARDQVEILGDDVGTVLRRTEYHRAAEGLGARGVVIAAAEEVEEKLQMAREACGGGSPVLINALIGRTEFRKGSISL